MSYKLDRQIGIGYSSIVYSGYSKTGQRVALKVIKTDKQMPLQQFLLKNEIHFLSTLDHENILKLIDYYEEPKQTIIITELYEEGTLESNLAKIDFDQESNIYKFVSQIASAFLYLKQRNIVHNDIKPSNILVYNQKYIIADFGFSCIEGKNNFKCILGTPQYMSPETLQAGKMTHQSDMWSLGVTIYEISQGKSLFSDDYDEATKQITKNFQLIFKPNTIPWVKQIITQLLNRNSDSRLTIESLHQIVEKIHQSRRISFPKCLKSYNIEEFVKKIKKRTKYSIMIYILDGILLLSRQERKNNDIIEALSQYLRSSLYILLQQQYKFLLEITKEDINEYQENINGYLNIYELYQYIENERNLQFFKSTFNYETLQYILKKNQL
ncbi:hypothetical protein pb186bvf_007236 [Paramecium bursaria]